MSEQLFVRELFDEDLTVRCAPGVPSVVREMQSGDIAHLYAVYADAFSSRPGLVLPEEVWVPKWPQHPRCAARVSTVATLEGTLIGYVLAYLDPETPEEGYIGQVGVRAAWCRQGVGSRMMERTMQAFRAEGLAYAALRVARDNVVAIATYRKLGFSPKA